MHIGIPKEIKSAEKRVALTPNACEKLVAEGHAIHVEQGAGVAAGYGDEDYVHVGCQLEADAAALYGASEMIVKVKEPLAGDVAHLRNDHLLFCYLHLAAAPELAQELADIGLTAVAFETVVEDGPDGPTTPLLAPMSAIAGRLATQIGTWHLHAPRGGRGTLLGGIKGMEAGVVSVIGAGVAGQEAARLAYGMGAHVNVLDINGARLQALAREMPKIDAIVSTPQALEDILPQTDILVGAVYVLGQKAPIVVTRDQMAQLPCGAVAVDIAIDQGGCFETSKPCTHDAPVYEDEGVIHSAITNLPAAAPRTASDALSYVIAPYVAQLANGQWSDALIGGINVKEGRVVIAL